MRLRSLVAAIRPDQGECYGCTAIPRNAEVAPPECFQKDVPEADGGKTIRSVTVSQ
jgi:hypothetical protein